MPFTTVLDAQTQIISAADIRKSLEDQFATYNDINDPSKSIRVGIKTEIKNIQLIIDSGNDYLLSNSTPPFRYMSEVFDISGNIFTPWDDESQIPGTVKYSISQLPVPTLNDLNNLYDQISGLVADSGQRLLDKQKTVADIKNSSQEIQNISLTQAQDDVDAEMAGLQALIESKNNLASSIQNISNPTPILTNDSFSNTIRTQIKDKLSQNIEFDNLQTQVEAALIMRRKALDALYTAKTVEQKKSALDRLNHSAELSDPIVKTFAPYNPNQFSDIITLLNTTLDDLYMSSQSLSAAQASLDAATLTNNTAQITAAQILYDNALNTYQLKEKVRIEAIDSFMGINDSKFFVTMQPGSLTITTHQINSTSGETQSNPNPETQAILDNLNRSNSTGKDLVFDTKTNQYIPRTSMLYGDSGRYVEQRYNTTPDYEQNLYNTNKAKVQQTYDNTTSTIQTSIDQTKSNYDTQVQALAQQDKSAQIADIKNNDNLTDSEKQALLQPLLKQQADIEAQKAQLDVETSNTLNQQNQALTDAKTLYDMNNQSLNVQKSQSINASQMTASVEEATSLNKQYNDAIIQNNQAERELSVATNVAIDNAIAAGVPEKDAQNPANWSDADRTTAQSKVSALNTARANEQTAAVNLDSYANTVPGGKESLLASGLSEDDLKNTLVNGPDSTQAVLARNNAAFSPDQIGLAANSIDSSNVTTANGFEGLNGGSPFYLQMPTLNSLHDFNIPNGLNPYAAATNDDIARDAIHFNIFQVVPEPPAATTVPGQPGLIINKVKPASTSSIGAFTIYPHSHDYLQMTHNHVYDKSDVMSTIIDFGQQLVGGVNTALDLASVAYNSYKTGHLQGIPEKVSTSIEKIDTYSRSDKLNLTIQFKLFTKDDFLNDIFRPLMFLTALSYPKRLLHGNIDMNAKILGNAVGGKGGNALKQVGQSIENVETDISSTGGLGPFRYYISRKPEYLSARHASGLFYFPLAAITNVSYSFEGAWYNAGKVNQKINPDGRFNSLFGANIDNVLNQVNPNQSLQQRLAAVGQTFQTQASAIGQAFRNLGQDVTAVVQGKEINLGGADDAFKSISPNSFAYPSIANCSITIANLVPTFRDDYVQLMNAAGQGGSSLVQVTQSQTGPSPAFNTNQPVTDAFSQIKKS